MQRRRFTAEFKAEAVRQARMQVYVQPPQCSNCEKTIDAGFKLIRAGFAWWYRTYAKEQSSEDVALYEQAENEARWQKRGLWVEDKPVPPWERRTKNKMRSQ